MVTESVLPQEIRERIRGTRGNARKYLVRQWLRLEDPRYDGGDILLSGSVVVYRQRGLAIVDKPEAWSFPVGVSVDDLDSTEPTTQADYERMMRQVPSYPDGRRI
jgi:hypothetical protein